MYKIIKRNGVITCVRKIENDVVVLIPIDPANTDYAEYLKWLEAGNQPLPPEEN